MARGRKIREWNFKELEVSMDTMATAEFTRVRSPPSGNNTEAGCGGKVFVRSHLKYFLTSPANQGHLLCECALDLIILTTTVLAIKCAWIR